MNIYTPLVKQAVHLHPFSKMRNSYPLLERTGVIIMPNYNA